MPARNKNPTLVSREALTISAHWKSTIVKTSIVDELGWNMRGRECLNKCYVQAFETFRKGATSENNGTWWLLLSH